MAEILALNPSDEERIHPRAVKRLGDWKAGIARDVPQLEELSLEEIQRDLDHHLSEEEQVRLAKCRGQVAEWLSGCMDIGDGYSPHPYSTWVVSPMVELASLVKKTYDRKAEKEREQQRQKVEKERREAAMDALEPPLEDAKTFLEPQEREEFEESIAGAVDAYLEKGEEYLGDRRAYAYRRWLDEIQNRREEPTRRNIAMAEARKFVQLLNTRKRELESRLSPEELTTKGYFHQHVRDPRYNGHTFEGLLPSGKKKELDAVLAKAVRGRLNRLVPEELRRFITREYRYSYFLLPSADYSHKGVPCLSFCLDVFAAIRAKLWLNPGELTFGGYPFHLQVKDEEGNFAALETPEFLGYYYLLLAPADLNHVPWQVIPLVLISGLTSGDTEPPGTTVIKASEVDMVYRVEGYEGEVVIPASFASYLKAMGGIDGMVRTGIIKEETAGIIRRRLSEMEAAHRTSVSQGEQADIEGQLPREGSKKALAYQLFSEGEGPSGPRVKALGLHKSTRFRYYNAWIADGRP